MLLLTGSGGEKWSYKSCKAPVRSSPPTNQHPIFLQAGCPSCRPTNSVKALKWKYHSVDLLTPNSPGGLPTLSLTTNSSWLPWGGLPCLSSALRQASALPQNAVLHLIAWSLLFKNVKASFGANFASFFRKQVPVFVVFMHCTVGGRLITSSCLFCTDHYKSSCWIRSDLLSWLPAELRRQPDSRYICVALISRYYHLVWRSIGNQEPLVVKDKVGRLPGEFGVSKCVECATFPFSALTLLVQRQEGHLACMYKAGCWFVDGDDVTQAMHIL